MDKQLCVRFAPDGFAPGGGGLPRAQSGTPDGEVKPQIRFSGGSLGGAALETKWKRKPNVTGSGATHVRSFHCRLAEESMENLDRQINEWLDAHPEYEVKFVSTAVGDWTGKLKEPQLIVQVWV